MRNKVLNKILVIMLGFGVANCVNYHGLAIPTKIPVPNNARFGAHLNMGYYAPSAQRFYILLLENFRVENFRVEDDLRRQFATYAPRLQPPRIEPAMLLDYPVTLLGGYNTERQRGPQQTMAIVEDDLRTYAQILELLQRQFGTYAPRLQPPRIEPAILSDDPVRGYNLSDDPVRGYNTDRQRRPQTMASRCMSFLAPYVRFCCPQRQWFAQNGPVGQRPNTQFRGMQTRSNNVGIFAGNSYRIDDFPVSETIIDNEIMKVTIFHKIRENGGHGEHIIPASVLIKGLKHDPRYSYRLKPRNEEPVNYSDLKYTVKSAFPASKNIYEVLNTLQLKYPEQEWYLSSAIKRG